MEKYFLKWCMKFGSWWALKLSGSQPWNTAEDFNSVALRDRPFGCHAGGWEEEGKSWDGHDSAAVPPGTDSPAKTNCWGSVSLTAPTTWNPALPSVLLQFQRPYSCSVWAFSPEDGFNKAALKRLCKLLVMGMSLSPEETGSCAHEDHGAFSFLGTGRDPRSLHRCYVPACKQLPGGSSREVNLPELPQSLCLKEGVTALVLWIVVIGSLIMGTYDSTIEADKFYWKQSNSRLVSLLVEGSGLCPLQRCLAEGLNYLWLGLSINLQVILPLVTKSSFSGHLLIYMLAACRTSQSFLKPFLSANVFLMLCCYWNLLYLPRVPHFSQKMCLVIEGIFRLQVTKQQY